MLAGRLTLHCSFTSKLLAKRHSRLDPFIEASPQNKVSSMRISGDLYKDDPPAVSVFPPSHISPLEGIQIAMPDSASIATAANAPSNRSRPDADYPLVLYETWHDLTSTYDPEDVPTSDAPRLRDIGENRSNGTQGHVSHDQERDWYVSLHDFRDCKRYRMPSRADHDLHWRGLEGPILLSTLPTQKR